MQKGMKMNVFHAYQKLPIDFSVIGLEPRSESGGYFCTPKGAKVFGWPGVDGVHYCFIRGFGKKVFVVCPMNEPGNYVRPVAENFEEFLCLLLACKDPGVIESAGFLNQERFDAFRSETEAGLSQKQREALEMIQRELALTPLENPYAYIKKVQESFDSSKLCFTDEYYEWVPREEKQPKEWKVYFETYFGSRSRSRAGKEISLNRKFQWGEQNWYVPSVYLCAAGIVVDFCVEVPAEEMKRFIDKWDLLQKSDVTMFREEETEQIEAEDPRRVDFSARLLVNGRELKWSHQMGIGWMPEGIVPEEMMEVSPQAEQVLEHYDLEPERCWVIRRTSFPWRTAKKPKLQSIRLVLEADPVQIPGEHIRVNKAGEQVVFQNPVNGCVHTMTVVDYERGELKSDLLPDEFEAIPAHYVSMKFTITPELVGNEFSLTDCEKSEEPKQKKNERRMGAAAIGVIGLGYQTEEKSESDAMNVSDVADEIEAVDVNNNAEKTGMEEEVDPAAMIIGGADGPTAIFLAGHSCPTEPTIHSTCSALHYQPVESVEWRFTFYEKRKPDLEMDLLSSE